MRKIFAFLICIVLSLYSCKTNKYIIDDVKLKKDQNVTFILPPDFLKQNPKFLKKNNKSASFLSEDLQIIISNYFINSAHPLSDSPYKSTYSTLQKSSRNGNDLRIVIKLNSIYKDSAYEKRLREMLAELRTNLEAYQRSYRWPQNKNTQEIITHLFQVMPHPADMSILEFAGPDNDRNILLLTAGMRIDVKLFSIKAVDKEKSKDKNAYIFDGEIFESLRINSEGNLYFNSYLRDYFFKRDYSFPECRSEEECDDLDFLGSCRFIRDFWQFNLLPRFKYLALEYDYDSFIKNNTYPKDALQSRWGVKRHPVFYKAEDWETLINNINKLEIEGINNRIAFIGLSTVTPKINILLNGFPLWVDLGTTIEDFLIEYNGLTIKAVNHNKFFEFQRLSPSGYQTVQFNNISSLLSKITLKTGDRIILKQWN